MAKAAKKSAKKTAAPKAPKSPKAPKAPKAEKTAAPKKAFNMLDPEQRALFLNDMNKYVELADKVAKAQSALRRHGKTVKADGFTIAQIKFAIQCQTPEGEKTVRMMIADNLLAAAYAGADIGEQLSLFLDEPRVPAVDRARKEGQTDAMGHKVAKPGYDPSTAQYRAYMEGYHEEQERQVKAGIKPLDGGGQTLITKEQKAAKAAKDAGPPPAPATKPIISRGMSHKEQSALDRAAKDKAKETAEKYFKPTTGDFGTA